MHAIRRASIIITAMIGVSMCQIAHAQLQQTKKEKEATGSIAGRLTLDGKAIPGVSVILIPKERPARDEQQVKTTSDQEGNFKFTGVRPGAYTIQTFTPVYVGNGETVNGDIGSSVILSEDEEVEGITIALTRGGVITGRVTDSAGQPLIEERIVLIRVGEGNKKFPFYSPYMYSEMMLTDDRGIYRIYGLPAGRYLVGVGVDQKERSVRYGFSNTSYERTYHPDKTDDAQATVVELAAGGEASDIDITLGRKMKGYTATGRIVDGTTGKPLPGIQYGVATVVSPNSRLTSSYTADYSNSRGEFRLLDLQPGHYAAITHSDNQTGIYSEAALFEVTDSDVSGLEIKVYRGSSISGQALVEGVSEQQSRALLADLRIISVINSGERRLSPNMSPVKLNADGSFTLSGLPPGQTSFFLFSIYGKQSNVLRIERDGVSQGKNIDIQPGERITGVKIYLANGSGRIRGQVKVEGDTLPEGAQIAVFARNLDPGVPSGGFSYADTRGNFFIEELTPGEYEVSASVHTRDGSRPLNIKPVIQKVTVTVDEELKITITLQAPKKDSRQ